MSDFLANDIVAIGWPGVGDIGGGLTRQDMAARLTGTYEHYLNDQKNELAVAAGILDRFANQIAIGDFVLVPNEDKIYVAEVKGTYSFHKELVQDGPDGGYPHWRKVSYLNDKNPFCLVKGLPLGVRRAIDCRLSVFSIHSAADAMWEFLGVPQQQVRHVNYGVLPYKR